MMRELPPPDQLLKVRDKAHILVLPPDSWLCIYCGNPNQDYLGTVVWIVGPNNEEWGRCSSCGQQYVLADA